MGTKIKEAFKTILLFLLFLILLFLLFYLPRNRAFQINSESAPGLLNLGKYLRIELGGKQKLLTDKNGWTNILLLGKAGQGNPAPELTDSIILFSLKGKKAVFLSLPRDLYVKAPSRSYYQKINSLVASGCSLQEVKKTIYGVTGRNVHYIIVGDLQLLKDITDYLGGLNVYVTQDIDDPRFPGPNYSYQTFTLKRGWRHLDGATALKYVRTRHDAEGDFGRMKRQQKVLAALKDKINNLNRFQNFSFILSLYNKFKAHIKTDMKIATIKTLWEKAKDLDINSSQALSLTTKKPALLREGYVQTSQGKMFVLYPEAGYSHCKQIHQYLEKFYQ